MTKKSAPAQFSGSVPTFHHTTLHHTSHHTTLHHTTLHHTSLRPTLLLTALLTLTALTPAPASYLGLYTPPSSLAVWNNFGFPLSSGFLTDNPAPAYLTTLRLNTTMGSTALNSDYLYTGFSGTPDQGTINLTGSTSLRIPSLSVVIKSTAQNDFLTVSLNGNAPALQTELRLVSESFAGAGVATYGVRRFDLGPVEAGSSFNISILTGRGSIFVDAVQLIPEPSAFALTALGAFGILGSRRRKKPIS